MVKEETLGRGPKGGGKEELGEEEWVSFNILSLKKTKIWQDYSISLKLKREEEKGFYYCFYYFIIFIFEWRRWGGLYSSGGENMNGRHLMRVDKGSWT